MTPEVVFAHHPCSLLLESCTVVAGCTFSSRCKVAEFMSLSPVRPVQSSTSICLRDTVSATSSAEGGEGFQGE